MRCLREMVRLYAVTDRSWVGKQTLLEQVESAVKGGVTCVQLREKELDEGAFLEEAVAVRRLCRDYGVLFIVNDNVEIALKCGADGIHVGQRDMSAGSVRALVGNRMMIGVSVQTVRQALEAERVGADYLGVGAVFSTTTKPDACEVSHQTLREICTSVKVPVVAIGGINKMNIGRLAGTGVDGVALVSAIFAAKEIERECRELKALSDEITAGHY